MKKLNRSRLFYIFLTIACTSAALIAVNAETNEHPDEQTLFTFNGTGELLSDIIEEIAGKLGYNVLLPQGAQAMKEKITFSYPEPMTYENAWKTLTTLLDMAEYIISEKAHQTFLILKRNDEAMREISNVYVNTPLESLPDSDETIRYLCYLNHMKVTTEPDSELAVLLKELLSPSAVSKIDAKANAVLLVDKSRTIRYALQFMREFDQPSYQELVEFIPLHNTEAKMVADILNEYILKIGSSDPIRGLGFELKKQPESMLFGKGTRIFAITSSNSLMVMGRTQAIEAIKKFVMSSIDVELPTGDSVLHVYALQYLNAEEFAPILQRIVESSRAGGTGQSEAGAAGAPVKGNERHFDQVIIKTDRPANADERKYYGGNRLVIAARNEDYKEIVKLIEQMDVPQPTVLLEIVVVDLSVNDSRLLGAITRTPGNIPFLNDMQFQTAHLEPGVIVDSLESPTTIATDLLRNSLASDGTRSDSGTQSIASLASPGSTVISLNDNDGKTWSMLQILKLFSNSKIITQPHITVSNNKTALVRVGETRLLPDESFESSGTAVVKNKTVPAELRIEIIPRISPDKTVTLQVKININDFIPGSDAQTTREMSTTANIASGSILSLGGLLSLNSGLSANKTPILADVPILGNLFKSQQKKAIKNNLTVFICATIIEPRLRKGVGEHTETYIKLASEYSTQSDLFDAVKDPISRWFFKTNIDLESTEDTIKRFVTRDIEKRTLELAKIPAPEPITKSSRRSRRAVKRLKADLSYANKTEIPEENEAVTAEELKKADEEKAAMVEQLKKFLAETENPLTKRAQTDANVLQSQPVDCT